MKKIQHIQTNFSNKINFHHIEENRLKTLIFAFL